MAYKTDTWQSPYGLCHVKIGIIKAEVLLHCNTSALLLSCFSLGFLSTCSIGTQELHEAFNAIIRIRTFITVSNIFCLSRNVNWFMMTAQMVITDIKIAGSPETIHFKPPLA